MPGIRHEGLKAITFDVGGTLIRPWPSVGQIYARVAADHGWPGLDADELNRAFAAAWRARSGFDYSREAWYRLIRETFQALIPETPPPAFLKSLYDRFQSSEVWQVYPDVFPALDHLRREGWKLGIISNWDERLRPLLEALGLTDRFDAIVVSCEVGRPKPDPAIFQAAQSALGLPPEALAHIGDSETEDLQGAQAGGSVALLLDRDRRREGRSDTIESLSKLCRW